MKMNIDVTAGAVREAWKAALAEPAPDVGDNGKLLDTAVIQLSDVELDDEDVSGRLAAAGYSWGDDDEFREQMDLRELGEFIGAIARRDRADALALASRLFTDAQQTVVERALLPLSRPA